MTRGLKEVAVLVGQSWRDSHNKMVMVVGFFEEMPIVLQRFLAACSAAFVAIPLTGFLPQFHPFFVLGAVALGSVLGGKFGPVWIKRKWRALEKAGLVDNGSYAFKALQRELAEQVIFVRDMNDRIDHEVGIKPITAYLRVTKEPSYLIDAGNLDVSRKTRLQEAVDRFAFEYATRIKGYFDRRELARQARERGENEEAMRIETDLREQLAATHSARADLWLFNYSAGVLD